jgi:radical SAM superfamily enzyme YgiQ (UPF0313 family)
MELMAKSGCKGLLIGFETASRESLKNTKKGFNTTVGYATLIKELHKLGISVQGCFVFGLDQDTTDIFESTVEFAVETGIDLPRFAVLTPFPGTALYQRMEQENRILTRDWEWYDGQHVVFDPLHMSVAELQNGHEYAWKKVYRWSSIGKRLWTAGNLKLLTISANLGYRFYAHNLHRFYNCDWQLDPLFPAEVPLSSSQNRATSFEALQESKHTTVCG